MSLAVAMLSLGLAADPTAGLELPAEFTITLFSGPDLANDIYCMHVDTSGRVVVAGRGYVRQLVDTDDDGRADKAVELIPAPADGPMGLLWEDDTLFVTCAGGVKKWTGVTGKEPSREKPTTMIKLKTGGEHDAHAVRRGPDGKLYVLCGNMAGVNAKLITANDSPVTQPVAGALLRMNDDGTDVAVIADGFRNPYDFDFDLNGTPFTYDSDNERCVGLPWYEPTRFYRILSGGNYGWLSPQHAQTWRLPPYWPSVVAPLVTAGRGSPTGVACYRHTSFPKEYHGGFFYADWTFGTVWFTHPGEPKPKATPFLKVSGENGFAPTGLAVDPISGDLFVSIGGRGTRGSVYRIHHTKGEMGKPIPFDPKPLPKWQKPAAVPLNAEALTNAKTDREKLAVVCGWFDALGGVGDPKVQGSTWEGYTFREPPDTDTLRPLTQAIRQVYPSGNDELNRECGRFLAAAEDDDPASVMAVTTLLDKQTDPVERVHTLIVLSRLRGERRDTDTTRVADALVRLDAQYAKAGLTRDRHWPQRLSQTVVALARYDARLVPAVIAHGEYGAADHLWLARLPGVDRQKVAVAVANQASGDPGYEWSAGHAEFLALLPDELARPLFKRMERAGFADAVAVQLAKTPTEADREVFVAGLNSTSAGVVTSCAAALARLPGAPDEELVPLVRAVRRFSDPKAHAAVRKALVTVLNDRTGESFETAVKWETWLGEKRPALAEKLVGSGFNPEAWKKRVDAIKWDEGDAVKGKAVFAKAQCAACHSGATSVGPSLVGVAKRFSREDLLTAVVDPNRDVADRYRTVRFATLDQLYTGVVIYEAADGVLLQTSADTTVRIPGKGIESRTVSPLSLMPAGLLDGLSDREVSDLFAYLKTVK